MSLEAGTAAVEKTSLVAGTAATSLEAGAAAVEKCHLKQEQLQ